MSGMTRGNMHERSGSMQSAEDSRHQINCNHTMSADDFAES